MSRIPIFLLITLLCSITSNVVSAFRGCNGGDIVQKAETLSDYFPKETNQTYMVTEHEANGQSMQVHRTLRDLCVCVKTRDGLTTGVTDTSNVILIYAPQSDTLVITHVEMHQVKRIFMIYHACSYPYNNN